MLLCTTYTQEINWHGRTLYLLASVTEDLYRQLAPYTLHTNKKKTPF